MKQDYKITTSIGEIVYTEPGKNGPYDMKIFTRFPKLPWAHSLYYIGVCLRLKGEVEDRNYPPEKGFQGRGKLMSFVHDCLYKKEMSIRDICIKHQIPLKPE